VTQFFIPGSSAAKSEQVYAYVIRYVKAMLDCEIDPARISSIAYRHDGEPARACVGEIEKRTRQLVIAILRSDAYLICTPYYGVQRGEPIRVELSDVSEVQYFAGLDNARENLKAAIDALDTPGSIQARIRFAAVPLAAVSIDDFPSAMVADFLSLKHMLSWRGNQADTLTSMSDTDAHHTEAAIRALYLEAQAAAPDGQALDY
jgi:hypothetical protein